MSPNTCSPWRGCLNIDVARLPQYRRDDAPASDLTAVKAAIKHLSEADRANLLAWLLIYYDDRGTMYSPQIIRRRKRIVIDGVEYWLALTPARTAE
jgi:hypothetical protein